MHVLVIEDDISTVRGIERILKGHGYAVDVTAHGEDGIELAGANTYDIILLDMILPDVHGFKILTRLRGAKIDTPILILSDETDVELRVKMLRAGADDYMVKPFHKDEFVARIQAVVRRSLCRTQSRMMFGPLALNLDRKCVEVRGTTVPLTIKEYEMFEALALRKGMPLSKGALFNQLYGGIDEPAMKIIDVFVCKLRKKLAKATNGGNYIVTVWGQGYQLLDPMADRAAYASATASQRTMNPPSTGRHAPLM